MQSSAKMNCKFLPYDPRLKTVARMLRNNMTPAEILLWNQLKQKRLLGYDFHRQKPIDEYVVDFFCPRLSLLLKLMVILMKENWRKIAKGNAILRNSEFTF